jgi:predicted ATPase/DNA-binding CsgD family transcriptional regulator
MTAASNLPGQLTSFIGRQPTIAAVGRLLAQDRLVTMVGPGGCGKTRLALEIAREALEVRPDGVFFVDLSGLSDPGLVPNAVVRAVGLPEAVGRDPVDLLTAQLSKRSLLVLLDNCEHLLNASALLVEALIRGCAGLWALATSRQPLGITGEVIVPVEGLELPDRTQRGCGDWLGRSEAGRLFIDRARMARPDFSLDDVSELVVAEICERLDGIPLALELAAARARLMSVQAIAKGLSDRFRLLVGSGRAGPSRHKTLLASIAWSCALLDENERSFLHRLSVFASGFTLTAAEQICSGAQLERDDVLRLLTGLVDKSLVQATVLDDRFRLHETMRAYAASELDGEGVTALIRDHHLDYFTELAKAMEPKSWTSELPVAKRALEPDLDNLRAALDWSVESKQLDLNAELIAALGHFFYVLGLRAEALGRCQRLLAANLDPLRLADVSYWAAHYSFYSDPATTLQLAWKTARLGRAIGDEKLVARSLWQVGLVQMFTDPREALKTLDEAIALARKTELHIVVTDSLDFKAVAYLNLGRPEEAFGCAEAAVREGEEVDYLWGTVLARARVAAAALSTGRLARALEEAGKVLQLGEELADPLLIEMAEMVRGEVLMYQGEEGAEEAFSHARATAEACADRLNLAAIEVLQAHLQVFLGQFDAGYESLELANAKSEAFGSRPYAGNRAVLAEVALRLGDTSAARRHLAAFSENKPTASYLPEVQTLRASARLARAEGQLEQSVGLACEALEAAFVSGAVLWVMDLLELVAVGSSDLGRCAKAARLLGAAEAQREVAGYVRSVLGREELAQALTGIELSLGRDAVQQARSEGRLLGLAEAVAYARRGRGSRSRPASGWASLTPTERRVAFLVCQRLTNAEIAQQLFVSTLTVKSHLTRVFAKLGVPDRRRLVAQLHGGAENASAPSVAT